MECVANRMSGLNCSLIRNIFKFIFIFIFKFEFDYLLHEHFRTNSVCLSIHLFCGVRILFAKMFKLFDLQ